MKFFNQVGVSYFSNRHLKHFITDLKDMKKDGFNSILHTFSEEDLLYSSGNVKDMVRAGKDYGFTTWIDPWALGRVFGGEALSNFLLENPLAWQLLSDNKRYPAACLNNPLFRNYMKKWADAAVDMGVDAVFWDEPMLAIRHKGRKIAWGCRCPYCRESFEMKNLRAMPVIIMDSSVVKFREDTVKSFILEMSAYVKQISKNKVKNSVALITRSNDTERCATFESMAGIKQIDSLGVDPCWIKGSPDVYKTSYTAAVNIKEISYGAGKTPHFWLQGSGYKKGTEGRAKLSIKAAADAGVRSLWVWGYKGGEMMSSIASDRPGVVWGEIVRGLKAISNPKS
jgi:hypothetical protein